jgi:pyruvate/2-oxoglutarate dehydrogenase complex dihydrolipoamide dehydrogenase (E3) component
VRNALFFRSARVSRLVVPWCTYTDPELAHVGLSEREARARGVALDTYTIPLSANDRTRTEGDEPGLVQLHTRRGSGRLARLAGASIVAPHAGELIGEVAVALAAGLGLSGLAGVIHPYPTRAEALKAAGGEYLRRRLTPWLARVLEAWMRLRR